jgi:CubicO group peptidase (beta-lactamase class C family)
LREYGDAMPTEPPLTGTVAPGFAPVRDAFADLLASGAETGGALAVAVAGRTVVDLRGGWADEARTTPWGPDTLVNTYSVGKPVAALCVLLLAARGRLGLDDPVGAHWAEFVAAGKAGTTIRHLLSHTSGLPCFPVPRGVEELTKWATLVGDLATAAPRWTPGTVAAEHALTYGHLLDAVVRRVDGRSLGRVLAEEIAGPWRLDLAFGLDPADQQRCAELAYASPDWPAVVAGTPGSLHALALENPAGCLDVEIVNGPAWRGTEFPAVNLHATATALARLYSGLLAGGTLGGVALWPPDLVREATSEQFSGEDRVLERPVRWTLGMQVEDDGSWGMGGIGGSVAYADPGLDMAFAYVTRLLGDHNRADALDSAVRECLGQDAPQR